MKSKKRMGLLTAIGLFSLCYCMYSQSEFTFTYDAAGNLTQRTYVVNMQASQARKNVNNDNTDSTNVVALSDKLKVTIFPNPTKGELKIQVSGVENNAEVDLALYNPNGQVLLRQKGQQGLSEMDLSGYPAGWYLLKVQSGTTVLNFKIVKD